MLRYGKTHLLLSMLKTFEPAKFEEYRLKHKGVIEYYESKGWL